jgi:hypothetical protein
VLIKTFIAHQPVAAFLPISALPVSARQTNTTSAGETLLVYRNLLATQLPQQPLKQAPRQVAYLRAGAVFTITTALVHAVTP